MQVFVFFFFYWHKLTEVMQDFKKMVYWKLSGNWLEYAVLFLSRSPPSILATLNLSFYVYVTFTVANENMSSIHVNKKTPFTLLHTNGSGRSSLDYIYKSGSQDVLS